MSKLKATNLEMREITSNSVKASVSITFNDALIVNDILIVNSKKGLFVSWPSRKYTGRDGIDKWSRTVNFTDDAIDTREKLSEWIMKNYKDKNFVETSTKTSEPSSKSSSDDDEDLPF